MQFRVRPNSRRSNQDSSLVEYYKPALDSTSLRAVGNKVEQLEAALISFQQIVKRDRQITNAGYIDVQKRLDRIEYKTYAAEQDLKQLGEIRQIRPIRETPLQLDYSKNDYFVLKQSLEQEKEAHKDANRHFSSLIQQINLRQIKIEQDIRGVISQEKQEVDRRITVQNEELRSIDGLKQRKIDQQYELMKGVIANAEKKIYQELQRKIRGESAAKDYIEDRISELKNDLAGQQKSLLATETKFIKETKLSLETLLSINNATRKELSDQLEQTQRLSVMNLKKISTAVDIIKDQFGERLQQIERQQEETNQSMEFLKGFVNEKMDQNRRILSEMEDNAMDRIDQELGNSGARTHGNNSTGQERILQLQKEMAQWKSMTEQKNLNVFKEISSTLKSMKAEWRKESEQISTEITNLGETVKSVKKSLPLELKKNIQTVITIFNNEFDVLAEELDLVTEMIALAKKESEKALKQQLSKQHQATIEQTKLLISQKGKESNSYTEKSTARSEQSLKQALSQESKYLNDLFTQKHSALEQSVQETSTLAKKNSLMTAAQLQDYSMKLKAFNDNYKESVEEQRKEDMRKRLELEETLRTNASSLMEIGYKKSEFLVDGLKKALEMASMKDKMEVTQQMANTKDELEKSIQINKHEIQTSRQEINDKVQRTHLASQNALKTALQQIKSNDEQSVKQLELKIQHASQLQTQQIHNLKLELQTNLKKITDSQATQETELKKVEQSADQAINKAVLKERAVTNEQIKLLKAEIESKMINMNEQQKMQEMKIKDMNSKIDVVRTDLEGKLAKYKQEMDAKNVEKEGREKQQNGKELLDLEKKLLEEIKKVQLKVGESGKDDKDDQAMGKLRQSVWKVQAMAFSEQAKNKALFDRLTEDVNHISENVAALANQLKNQ